MYSETQSKFFYVGRDAVHQKSIAPQSIENHSFSKPANQFAKPKKAEKLLWNSLVPRERRAKTVAEDIPFKKAKSTPELIRGSHDIKDESFSLFSVRRDDTIFNVNATSPINKIPPTFEYCMYRYLLSHLNLDSHIYTSSSYVNYSLLYRHSVNSI